MKSLLTRFIALLLVSSVLVNPLSTAAPVGRISIHSGPSFDFTVQALAPESEGPQYARYFLRSHRRLRVVSLAEAAEPRAAYWEVFNPIIFIILVASLWSHIPFDQYYVAGRPYPPKIWNHFRFFREGRMFFPDVKESLSDDSVVVDLNPTWKERWRSRLGLEIKIRSPIQAYFAYRLLNTACQQAFRGEILGDALAIAVLKSRLDFQPDVNLLKNTSGMKVVIHGTEKTLVNFGIDRDPRAPAALWSRLQIPPDNDPYTIHLTPDQQGVVLRFPEGTFVIRAAADEIHYEILRLRPDQAIASLRSATMSGSEGLRMSADSFVPIMREIYAVPADFSHPHKGPELVEGEIKFYQNEIERTPPKPIHKDTLDKEGWRMLHNIVNIFDDVFGRSAWRKTGNTFRSSFRLFVTTDEFNSTVLIDYFKRKRTQGERLVRTVFFINRQFVLDLVELKEVLGNKNEVMPDDLPKDVRSLPTMNIINSIIYAVAFHEMGHHWGPTTRPTVEEGQQMKLRPPNDDFERSLQTFRGEKDFNDFNIAAYKFYLWYSGISSDLLDQEIEKLPQANRKAIDIYYHYFLRLVKGITTPAQRRAAEKTEWTSVRAVASTESRWKVRPSGQKTQDHPHGHLRTHGTQLRASA